jgi:hypothetical protein
MNLSRQDLRAVRMPLLMLAAVLVTGTAAIYFTRQDMQAAQAQLEQSRNALSQAQQRLTQSGDEENLIKQNLPEYRQWQQRGFIGTEQRIDWLDAIRTIGDKLHLPGVIYSIEAQQRVTTGPEIGSDRLQLYRSLMKLRLPLLHEEDLTRFLDELAAQKVGLFSVDECTIGRGDGAVASLLAECTLSWYTIGPVKAGAIP